MIIIILGKNIFVLVGIIIIIVADDVITLIRIFYHETHAMTPFIATQCHCVMT